MRLSILILGAAFAVGGTGAGAAADEPKKPDEIRSFQVLDEQCVRDEALACLKRDCMQVEGPINAGGMLGARRPTCPAGWATDKTCPRGAQYANGQKLILNCRFVESKLSSNALAGDWQKCEGQTRLLSEKCLRAVDLSRLDNLLDKDLRTILLQACKRANGGDCDKFESMPSPEGKTLAN